MNDLRLVFVVSLLRGQIVQRDFERAGNPGHRVERASFLASLDLRQVGAAEAGHLGQLRDGQAAMLAKDAHRLFSVDQRLGDVERKQFFVTALDARLDFGGVAAVDEVFIVLFGQDDERAAIEIDFLHIAHRGLLSLVDSAARAGIDNPDDIALVVDDDTILTDADAPEVTALQLLDIDLLAPGISLDLGDDGSGAARLHLAESFLGGGGDFDPFHGDYVAYSDIERKKNVAYSDPILWQVAA